MTINDRKRLRRLQDRFLDSAVVRRFLNERSPTEPMWPGGPSRNELADFVYPQWESKILSLLNASEA